MDKQTILFFVTSILVVSIFLSQNAFADSSSIFASLKGTYNNNNGMLEFDGLGKYVDDYKVKVSGYGVIKEWMINDSSIPTCKHAFSDDFKLYFHDDKNQNVDVMFLGKMCSLNSWNDTWKGFRANYFMVDGNVGGAKSVSGTGYIEITINTKQNLAFGIIKGNMALH